MALTDEQRKEAETICPGTLATYDQGGPSVKSTEEDVLKRIDDFKIRMARESKEIDGHKPQVVLNNVITDPVGGPHIDPLAEDKAKLIESGALEVKPQSHNVNEEVKPEFDNVSEEAKPEFDNASEEAFKRKKY